MLLSLCAATILILPPGEKKTLLDLQTVERAKVRCEELYPQSPCAKKVVRTKPLTYRVYCGKESK